MKRTILMNLLLVGVMSLCTGILTAQQTTAKIFGVVQLEDGSLVSGVSVEATSPKLVGKTTALTAENGVFRLMHLAPGVYKLVFSLPGFQTVIRENIRLRLEQTLNLKIEMKLGNIEEAMNIVGQTPKLDVRSTAKSMALSREAFQLMFANFYLEYNLKLGKNNLNINLNVDNITDTKTARRIYPIYTQETPSGLTEQRIADGPWDINDYIALSDLDPRYLKGLDFYPPLTARLGLKFSF